MKVITAIACLVLSVGILLGKQSFGSEVPVASTTQQPTAIQWIAPEVPPARPADAEKQIQCLAENVYYEARGESFAGQVAVALVTVNRTRSGKFPDTICKVVHQPFQFSWTRLKGRFVKDKEAWQTSVVIARVTYETYIVEGVERAPLHNATYFHTTGVSPAWRKKFKQVAVIDNHRFYAAN